MKNTVFISNTCKNIITITSIITFHYFEFSGDYLFEGESHPFWELLYVDKGDFLVTTNGQKHHLKQGDIIFHKPNEFHANESYHSKPVNVFVLSFVCNSKVMQFFESKQFSLTKEYRKLIGQMIQIGQRTYEMPLNDVNAITLIPLANSLPGGQQLVRIYIEQLLLMLLHDDTCITSKHIYQTIEAFDDVLIHKVITYLKNNIYNSITIQDVCQELNYSKTHLSVRFKNYTKKTIIEYYQFLKIEESKLLLRQNQHSISEISHILCFTTPYYFSTVFKNITGMSPSAYCKLAINSTPI
ncbi:MAG: AraC family transcriptional regulator [Eubacteriales bacterium]